MPTPPPWWSVTQVAPDAVLSSALSKGQSETASDPSRIASVSRLGEATEPESRWSRPIPTEDRKSVVQGKSGSARVDLGGRRRHKRNHPDTLSTQLVLLTYLKT